MKVKRRLLSHPGQRQAQLLPPEDILIKKILSALTTTPLTLWRIMHTICEAKTSTTKSALKTKLRNCDQNYESLKILNTFVISSDNRKDFKMVGRKTGIILI